MMTVELKIEQNMKTTGDVRQLLISLQVADKHQIRETAPLKCCICTRIPSWKVRRQKKEEKRTPPPTRHHKMLLTSLQPQGRRLHSHHAVVPHKVTWARLCIVYVMDVMWCCSLCEVKWLQCSPFFSPPPFFCITQVVILHNSKLKKTCSSTVIFTGKLSTRYNSDFFVVDADKFCINLNVEKVKLNTIK